MKIHILDTYLRPEKNTIVTANCLQELPFYGSIEAKWEDGRVCNDCLIEHRRSPSTPFTLAFVEFENDEEAKFYFDKTGHPFVSLPRKVAVNPVQSVTTSPRARIGSAPTGPEKVK